MITRQILPLPDGGMIFLDHGYHCAPKERPYHLVGCGQYFKSVEDAQIYIKKNWNKKYEVDNSYALMEARFGEYEGI